MHLIYSQLFAFEIIWSKMWTRSVYLCDLIIYSLMLPNAMSPTHSNTILAFAFSISHTHSGNTKTININETLYEYISGSLLIIPNPDRVVVILSLSKSYAVEFMALFSHWFTNHNLYETMKHFHHLCGIVTIAKYCSIAWIKSVDLLVLVEISNL